MHKTEVIVCGARGRMGVDLLKIINDGSEFHLTATATRQHPLAQAAETLPKGLRPVVIDFSTADAVVEHARIAYAHGFPLLVGVSGIDEAKRAHLKEVSASIPVMIAANTSVVANLLAFLGAQSARFLSDADVEISEVHHRHKKDSPSGTAYFLGEQIAQARGSDLARLGCFDRHSRGPRKAGEIGIVGLRGGDVAGTHTIHLFNEGETLELTHRVTDRLIFAKGALKAAQFLASQTPGLYNMLDMFKMDALLEKTPQ